MTALGPIVAALAVAADPAAELARADEAFSRACAAHDVPAFSALLEEDALFGGARGLVEGREAVVARWRPFLTPGGPSLRWAPTRAELAPSGDLGFTVGSATYEAPGKPPQQGEYVTVWRRAADGRVRVALDLSLEPVRAGGERRPRRQLASRDGALSAEMGELLDAAGHVTASYLVVRRRAGDASTVAVETVVPIQAPPG